MNKVFVGRQPIYDRKLGVEAYELLFRSGDANKATFFDGNVATSSVVLNTFVEIGIDQIVGPHRAFLNLTREFFLEGHAHQLPADRVVLEILEDVAVDAELVACVEKLKGEGYVIALDDFVMNEEVKPLIALADIVKVEIPALDAEGIADHARSLLDQGVARLLAEKVETQDVYDHCLECGFHLFQGYFFSKPTIVEGRGLPPNKLVALEMLSKISQPDSTLDDLEAVISKDVGLSYKLLRIINSSFYGLPNKVDSIRQALALLGQRRIKSWLSLIVLSQASDKPQELVVTAMIRARMCELIAEKLGRSDTDTLFTVGLFSALDALLDAPMEAIVEKLPLSEEVRDALLGAGGMMGKVLQGVLSYERANWEKVEVDPLAAEKIAEAYLTAVSWADEAGRSMFDEG